MKPAIFALLLATLLLSACGNNDENSTGTATREDFDMGAARTTIDSINQQFAQAMLAGDSAALVNMYHSNAVVYAPNVPVGDRMASGSMAKTMPASGIKNFTLRTTDLEGNADMLLESGTYEMGDGNRVMDKGKYMVAWKPENGQWKLYRDMWNSDMPVSAN